MPSPAIAVYKDNTFLDELHRRLSAGMIRVDLVRSGEGFSQIRFVTGKQTLSYAFEAIAYEQPVGHL